MKLTDRDLTKGNWFKCVHEDKSESPIQIKDSANDFVCEVYVNENFVKVLYDNIKPIPLTVEILENSGFKHRIESLWVGIVDVIAWDKQGEFYLTHDEHHTHQKIEFVHELQNIVYALTKTELEIKL